MHAWAVVASGAPLSLTLVPKDQAMNRLWDGHVMGRIILTAEGA